MDLQDIRDAIDRGEREEARDRLRDYLNEHPDDVDAQQMMEQLADENPPPQRTLRFDGPASGEANGSFGGMMGDLVSAALRGSFSAGAGAGTERAEELGTYEMIWDCKFCGAGKLPAKTYKFCPNCGAAQDPASRRFPSDDEKRAVENYTFRGVDIVCKACSTVNPGDSQFCSECGASLETGERAAKVAAQTRAEHDAFSEDEKRDLDQEAFARDTAQAQAAAPRRGGINPRVLALVGVIGVIIIGIFAALFWQREQPAMVMGHTWQREIFVQEFGPVSETAWCDQMPGDAYSVTSRREQRSTRRLQDGESCSVERVDNGDGSFSQRRVCEPTYREEPVYDDRCYFTVDRWFDSRTVTSNGDSLAEAPFWAQANLQAGTCMGCERESGRDEDYILILRAAEDRQYECEVPYELWQGASVESTWTLQVGVVTGQPDCESLQPAR